MQEPLEGISFNFVFIYFFVYSPWCLLYDDVPSLYPVSINEMHAPDILIPSLFLLRLVTTYFIIVSG